MTTQQLSHFHTALMGLFDQATAKPSPFASNVLLSPYYFQLGAVLLLPPVTHVVNAFGGRHADSSPATHSVPSVGPAGAIQSP
jgi:hypothetical protein